LPQRLRDAIARLNPNIPPPPAKTRFQTGENLDTPVLLAAYRNFHKLLVNGVPVSTRMMAKPAATCPLD